MLMEEEKNKCLIIIFVKTCLVSIRHDLVLSTSSSSSCGGLTSGHMSKQSWMTLKTPAEGHHRT